MTHGRDEAWDGEHRDERSMRGMRSMGGRRCGLDERDEAWE